MAGALGLPPDEFVRAYVRRVGTRRSLTELPGGDCILWRGRDRGCAVYRVRPVQCQTFPFWREHVRSRAAWERLATSCPGVQQGTLHLRREIEARLRQHG